ncbi:MAG: valine--tRNA ligase [Candidatus Gracilibacteria bacterium]|jgi:valyl-tRNA synthetase
MSFDIEKAYDAKKFENKIYEQWEKSGCFSPKKGKKTFAISMPPPNATGVLHLGHAVMLALEDIMIRYHRMQGDSTLWLPGTDHAAIATQSVVEKNLQKSGIKNPRQTLGRDKLLTEVRKFVEESKSIIRNQVKKMGSSCDWSREKYTLDDSMNLAVNTMFKNMLEDGLIYRGGRIVNWDPKMQTTVADDELEYVEQKTKFYYFQYGPVVIGTARPETKFGDKVIVVHPKDKRYKHMIGKEFDVEWIEGKLKARVIADECIDMNFGTGAMTITPAHSLIDFELSQKYKLDAPQIIDFNGKIRKDVSKDFGGMPILEAREKVVERLKSKGLLVKVEEGYLHNLAVNYRGNGSIEPQIMKQWFVDVNKKIINWKGKKRSIKEVLIDTVKSGMIKIVPERFDKTYFHWINNLHDWCISRQIWWGHQIPIWYKVTDSQYREFSKIKDASTLNLELIGINGEAKYGTEKPKNGLWVRDPDTLDTWFSSAMWTFATLGWPKNTADLKTFHPTNVMETGYDILFFWVARMILASTYALRRDGLKEEKCLPFKTVYLHGLIRDIHGKKMSKSRPETCIDPLEMIEKYGTDAVRLSLVVGSSPGNDMRLYEEKIAGYRNFVNKIWNSARFALLNVDKKDLNKKFTKKSIKSLADKWILSELNNLVKESTEDLENYRFSEAVTKIYDFVWSKYCDWYLEISKGEHKNPEVLLYVLKTFLKLLHPFTPYVTEKLWDMLGGKTLLIAGDWPKYDKSLNYTKEVKDMGVIHEIINGIRRIRAELKVDPAKKIKAVIYGGKYTNQIKEKKEVILRMARLETLEISNKGTKIKSSKNFFIESVNVYLPLKDMVDIEQEKKKTEAEILRVKQNIQVLESKLKNKGFTDNAPKDVIEKTKHQLDENILKLKNLLAHLG